MSLHLSSNCGLSTSLRVGCRTYGSGEGSGGRCTALGHDRRSPMRISLSNRMLLLPSQRTRRLLTQTSLQPAVDEPIVEPEVVEEPIPRAPSFRHNLPSGKRLEVIVQKSSGSEDLPPIIFLHGSYHGAWCWEKWMPYLSERGHDCYAVSFLGQVHIGSHFNRKLRASLKELRVAMQKKRVECMLPNRRIWTRAIRDM